MREPKLAFYREVGPLALTVEVYPSGAVFVDVAEINSPDVLASLQFEPEPDGVACTFVQPRTDDAEVIYP